MKTKIEVFCDSSCNKVGDKDISKLVSIYFYMNRPIKINVNVIQENNSNRAELINLLNCIKICNSLDREIKANNPIIIYSDSRYAIDTLNQFFSYVKQLRGNKNLYDYFLQNNYCQYQKTNKFFSYSKANKRIFYCNEDPNEIINILMNLMNTNKLIFKWIPRDENQKADYFSKIK